MSNYYSDFADESLKHVTDTLGKHTLTDVKEENEDDAVSTNLFRRGIGSIDAIWDTHGHRLSEAGLSRHQDNSILTEDTDSFIIGDRIWVGGSKPGQIAYIGETQFAPGEWAGIVLDHPIGKNDGSVGGTRYFQCEAKRGVFSRLTRLTRFALPGADDTSICSSSYAVSTPINNGVRKRVESPVSPTGSTKGLLRTPPPFNVSNTSLSSIPHIIDFKVGDRVIIKSSQGSKIGTVRYIGTTDFAAGEWCGVELDEPRGKNDGTVEGKKYFTCAPLFGLFAPVSKVSKSPLKYKPGNCVIHTGAGTTPGSLPPSGIKRMGSKESVASMTSSITSAASGARRVRLGINSLTPQKASPKPVTPAFATRSALQDVLREKQQHIEQLLKERDLDRIEFSKAATHTEELVIKLSSLKTEYEQYRVETETKLREYVDVLTKLNKDRGITLSQLDDEKRRNEDLQFKFEEAAITKGDIEVNSKAQAFKIQELEGQLAAERLKLNNFEGDSSKLFEAEEALVETREEVEVLKKEVEMLVNKNEALIKEQNAAKESVTELKRNLDNVNVELQTLRKSDNKIIQKLQEDLSTASLSNNEACTELNKEIQSYVSKLQEKSDTCQKYAEEIATLRIELDENKVLVKENINKINQYSESELNLTSVIEKLKQDLSSKIFDLETSAETIQQKNNEIADLKAQHETIAIQSQTTTQEIDVKHKNEIDEFEKQLLNKDDEYKVIMQQLEESNNRLTEITDVNKKLTADLETVKKDSERVLAETKAEYDKEIGVKTTAISAMGTDIQSKIEELGKTSDVVKQLELDLTNKTNIIQALEKDASTMQTRLENNQVTTTKLNEQVQALQLETGDLQRKLTATEQQITELLENKLRLEQDLSGLVSSSGNYSEQMQQLTLDLKTKDELLNSTKTEFSNKIQQLEHALQESELKLHGAQQESEQVSLQHKEILQAHLDSEAALQKSLETATNDQKEKQTQLVQFQRLLDDAQSSLKDANEARLLLETEMSNTRDLKIEELNLQLTEKESIFNKLQIELNEKVHILEDQNKQLLGQLQDLQNEVEQHNEKLKKAVESETQLLGTVAGDKKEIENAQLCITQLKHAIDEKDIVINTLMEEKRSAVEDLSKAVGVSDDTSAKVQQLTFDIASKDDLLQSTNDKLNETTQQLHTTKEELLDIQRLKSELDQQLQELLEKQNNLQKQYDLVFSDKQKASLSLDALKLALSEHDVILKEKAESEIALKEELDKLANEKQTFTKTIADLTSDNSIMKEQLSQKSEVENLLKQETESRKTATEELEKLRLELKTQNEGLEKLQTETLNSAEKDGQIAQLTTEVQASQQLITQLQIDKGNLELEKIDVCKQLATNTQLHTELLNQVAALTKQIELENKTADDLKAEKNNYIQIFEQLQLSEKQMQQLVVRLEGTQQNGKDSVLQLVKGIQIGTTEDQTKNVVELHKSLEATRLDLKESNNRLQNQQNEVLRLQEALMKTQNNNNNHNQSDNHQQLLDEKELAEGQIQFLNAIIVDMQRKNEEQQMRIQLLESGFSPAAASELKLYGVPQGAVAPRIYCDICEEFDKHQTEDCPIQGSDFDAPANHTHSKQSIPERPYCDICEVFGHLTEDCKEDETY